ncbi:NF-kappa-B inhibitor cactus-like [Apis dorsata]|uniref:NF-kappa-B inhibitor cactus-like n=1 Tax=Apis dorsata TaxID=7462 RepID=UPI00129355E0|nr:NF-kappa-B inhibitor cactus-like [Apis dorsata]
MWNGYLEWVPLNYYYYPQQEIYENYYSNCMHPTYENFQTDPQYNYQSPIYNINIYNTNVDLNEDLNQLVNNEISEPVFETFTRNRIEDTKQYEHEQVILNELWQGNYVQTLKGDPLLHWTITQGFVESACAMIRTTLEVEFLNVLNSDGQSPLHLAVLAKQPRIIRELILAGANPEVRNFRGNTPLHLSCSIGDFQSTFALVSPLNSNEYYYLRPGMKVPILPQNLELRNYDGQMCIHIAVSSNHIELVRLLIDHGANIEAREGLTGRTALHLAIERAYESIITLLLQKSKTCLNTKNYAGKTAYQLARNSNSQYTKILKKKR